jgi:Protein of unknown function (DUF2911)
MNKRNIVAIFFLLFATAAWAQQKPTEIDKSTMDMNYWPSNYPFLKMAGKVKENPIARIIYSRPLKNNREIFGSTIKYNELWRLGANEATEIEFFKSVKVGNKTLPKGRYTLYCIPSENTWTIIFNNDNFCWGSFVYDKKKDVLRTNVAVETIGETIEAFTMFFEEQKKGVNLIIEWDNKKAFLPLSVL